MNEKLQFSWGHIFAFLALIIVSYVSFVGFTYLTNGNFSIALIGMGITDLFYILFFIGAQQMKASGIKMNRKIVWERIFIFGSPLVFIAGMISMSHFFTVYNQNDKIIESFTSSINNAKQLFSDYEAYSNNRIENYEKGLNEIIANRTSDKETFKKVGLSEDIPYAQRDNMVELLRLQLLSQNYDSLKTIALKWIDEASNGASTFNVFLLGNTREIKDALNTWENQLKNFSAKEISNESLIYEVPHFTSNGAQNAINGIDGLTDSFTSQKFPTISAFIFGIIIYFMLLFPYILQDRHTKSPYKNIAKKKYRIKQININDETPKNNNTPHRGTFRLD